MIHQLRWRRITAISIFTLLLVSPLALVSAQSSQPPGSGLQISPTRHELTIEPGTSQTVTIGLKNVSGTEVIANAAINDFEADNKTGEPKLNVDPNSQSPSSIKKFISNIEDVPLAKDQVKEIVVKLSIPASTTPGAYYGVVRYRAVPVNNTDEGNVSLTASVGTIMLIQVPGEINESMQVISLSAQKGDRLGSFFTSPPDKMAVEVRNTGNSFLKPFGRITISNMSNKEVYSYEINDTDPKGNVLPSSNRIFTNDIKEIGSFGRYTAIANLGYGDGSEVLTIRTTFWVVPLWMLIALAVILLVLTVGITILVRKLKRRSVKR